MRPSSSRVVILWIAALCLLAVLFSLDGLVSAQTAAESKRKLSQHALLSQRPLVSGASAQKTKPNAPPPLTADSWTGLSGDNNWGTAGNWTGGVPTGADAVTIGAASVDVNMNVNGGVFGTLALSNSGDELTVPNGFALNADGNITNNGTVMLNSAGGTTELVLQSNVILSGSGTVTLSNNFSNYILGAASTDTLTNQETISGAGQIGDGQMGLVNSGTINANASDNLIINVGTATVNNTGTLEAAGGTLTIEGSGTTFFTNDNQTTNTLTGGTYIANGNNIQWAAGTDGIKTLSANVTEENGGQLINTTNSSNALAGLTSITSAGALTIGGVAFTDAGSFSNAGSLTLLSGESFTVGSLNQISSGRLTAGTYVLDANLNLSGTAQTITVNAANLTLAGGTIENTSNSTNALAGLASNTGKLTIGGTSNAVSTTASSFSNAGTLTIDAGDSFTAHRLTQISSGTLTAGTYVLGGNLDLSTTGISVTTNAANLTLQGGTIKSGSANALAALANNTGSLTIAGANHAISTTAASFSNTGTLTIDASDSFTAGNLTQISSGTLSGGTYVLGGNLDLTTSGISVTTNSANLTLEGGTINSDGVNALSALAANTANLTIAGTSTAVSTTAASFSNTGTLTIGTGDSFTAPALTQISTTGGITTLTGGTYVLGGNLDLNTIENITVNSAVLTLEGGSIETGTTNDLANLNSNTDSLTLASKASFAATGNFTNSGALTIDSGSTFSLTGTHTLTNLSAGTLGSGTYTIGGTLQLTTTNGSITTNAANLTLTGTTAKILDGTANALSTFANNTGTFTLASAAILTTAPGNFSNSGTVDVEKGSTLTVGGTGHSYNQTAGLTTVDGTLSGGTTGSAKFTGGSLYGAGSIKANTTVGNTSGAAVTINVGDSGAAGLLAITGTYTQLATATMNVSIGGLTTGTYSELTVSGATSLGGTLTVAIVNGLVLTSADIGDTFTILASTGTLSGSFTNGTVTVGSDVFTVSYPAGTKTVVLTLSSVTGAPAKKSQAPAAQSAVAGAKQTATGKIPTSGPRQRVVGVGLVGTARLGANRIADPIRLAGIEQSNANSGLILGRTPELNNLRSWENVPAAPVTIARPIAVAHIPGAVNATSPHNNLAAPKGWVGDVHPIGASSTLAGWTNNSVNQRVPVKILLPSLPKMTR